MKRVGLFVLLVVLTGCAASPYPSGTPQAICWKQANNDLVVQQLQNQAMTAGGMTPYIEAKIRYARHRAMQSCLLSKGAAPPGGVEPVERY